MNIGHVEGGTNAGWRRVRAAHKPWFCGCYVVEDTELGREPVLKQNPGYRAMCDDCGNKRPS